MLIVITGDTGIGKTTVCQNLVQMVRGHGYSCGGVISHKEPDGGIAVEDIWGGRRERLAGPRPLAEGPRTGRYFFYGEGIRFGTAAIENGLSADVLFVDELGPLELRREGFSRAIELVNSAGARPTVLVVRKELLRQYQARLTQEPVVFEITYGNRGNAPAELMAALARGLTKSERPFISAIVLAAGESKRLEGGKLLLPFRGSTILETTIDNLLLAGLNEVIVVVGHRAEDIIKLIGRRPIRIVRNDAYRKGMGTSIKAGLTVLDNRVTDIMLVLGDQPFIGSETIGTLIKEYRDSGKDIAAPVCRGRRGHPVIFSGKYRRELMELTGDTGGREIIARHPDDFHEVKVEDEGIFTDIDTIETYQSVTNVK